MFMLRIQRTTARACMSDTLTVVFLQLLTTEDWHNTFYSYTGPYRREDRAFAGFIALYFVFAIVLGNRILSHTTFNYN